MFVSVGHCGVVTVVGRSIIWNALIFGWSFLCSIVIFLAVVVVVVVVVFQHQRSVMNLLKTIIIQLSLERTQCAFKVFGYHLGGKGCHIEDAETIVVVFTPAYDGRHGGVFCGRLQHVEEFLQKHGYRSIGFFTFVFGIILLNGWSNDRR